MSIYISQYPKYCVYLTIYSGNKLPQFYIGSGKIENILNKKKPYRGSVKSKKYRDTWKQELKENPHLFRTIIIEKFYSRKNATYHERLLQIKFNVVKSDKFINMSIAAPNGFFGTDNSGENNPLYGKSPSEKTKELWSKIRKNKNVGKDNAKSIQINIDGITYESKNAVYKTLGWSRRKLRKYLNNENPHVDKRTTIESKERIRKMATGRVNSEKAKENMKNSASKESKEIISCPHCGKSGGKPSMIRWHFDNCKLLCAPLTINDE